MPYARSATAALLAVACAVALVSGTAGAQSHPRRRERDRFEGGLTLGLTSGVGSPLGLAGAFVEWRILRSVAIAGGGGVGGWFGPSVAATVHFDPISTTGWALGAAASLSHSFAWWFVPQNLGNERHLPDHADWVSLSVQTQIRPNRRWFVRAGAGRTFLLNTSEFRLFTSDQLPEPDARPGAFPTQLDAMRSAARLEGFATWFAQIDLGFNFWH